MLKCARLWALCTRSNAPGDAEALAMLPFETLPMSAPRGNEFKQTAICLLES